ncbi:MAG TPA: Ig-like domain-containing protein [Longimicrobium sp.]
MRGAFVALYGAAAALAAAGLAASGGCAHVEAPPGGVPDSAAPRLESTRPDTFARLRSYLGAVVFQYDEGLSERGVDTLVTVSPRTSSVAVDKSGSRISVSLRRGWEPNRVYQVTVHPGLTDLFGNTTKEAQTLVFSTGPEIVPTVATGRVVLRTTLEAARGARVELIHQPDSVLYETRPDSAGRWVVMYLPEGDYRVRAYNDTNHDDQLQPYEAFDTTFVRVVRTDTARARRLALLAPDTSAPKPGSATGEGDVIEVKFDDFLDPAQPPTAAQVTVTAAGGAAVAVREVRVGPFPDTAARADSAAQDTGRAAAARRDSIRAAAAAAAAAARNAEPVPSQSLFVRTAQPLAPDTRYTVTVVNARNLVGLAGGGQVELRTARAAPAPPPPAPTRSDSVRPAPTRPGGQPPAPPPPRPQTSPAPVAAPPRGRR